MGNEINIAKLLKDCPKGMELDCLLFKDTPVYFKRITSSCHYPIEIKVEYPDGTFEIFELSKEGCIYDRITAKCVIFPKGKTTWEGFQRPFKDGDIVTYRLRGSLVAFIYKERINPTLVKSHFALYAQNMGFCKNSCIAIKEDEIVFATEEEKEKLFQSIKEHGFKWNPETKTLEILKSKFETGDVITYKQNNASFTAILNKFVNFVEIHYYCALCEDSKTLITNNYFVGAIEDIRHATEKEKRKLFDVIRENGYKWNAYKLVRDKFNISTLIPFESRVLVRNYGDNIWKPATFGCFSDNFFYVLGGNAYKQCIPYEGNERLRGNKEDCAEYYKTWEL